MPLLRVTDLSLHLGLQVILDHADFQLFKGDRICLVGRNGAGKSTLMKLVEGVMQPDSGNIWRRPSLCISRLEQELPKADQRTVKEVIASGLAGIGELLNQYSVLAAQSLSDEDLNKLEDLQQKIEAADGWNIQQRIDEIISRLDLPEDKPMSELSGGWRRRVALGKALVTNPDVLLLDEPTNHLDIQAISWLEKQLLEFQGAVLFITHDRALVRSLATKIAELDRGHLTIFNGGYDNFVEEREHLLEVERQQNALFDKKLAQEEVWIRQGIKARRTRNEGRVRALEKLRGERAQRRQVQGVAKIEVEAASTSGKLVAQVEHMGVSFNGQTIFSDLTFNIIRGDKIGLLGPNGIGKTTLLKVLLGEQKPTKGSVKLGTKLDIAYYDQMRDKLDDNKTIVDVVGQGRDSIEINGKSRHIMSYLADFLFSAPRARTPLKALSGGERNRVQLACLFSQPANILVLDEPTNDLDVETLELLESVLVDFSGTVLLVSHDREFMDNVVTGVLAFEGKGKVVEYVGGYKDWLRQGGQFIADVEESVKAEQANALDESVPEKIIAANTAVKVKAVKLSYKDQRELDALPELITTLEDKQQKLELDIAAPNFYQQEQALINKSLQALAEVSSQLELSYERWVELSGE